MARAARRLGGLVGALLALAGAAQAAAADVAVIDLKLSGGGVQRVWYRQPEQPVAAVVLFTGGDGNFLVRTREQWVAHGFAVAVPDAPGGTTLTSRLSRTNQEILARIVEAVHARSGAPIWLVGTSRGTISAAGGAGRLTAGEIAGVVLTSSVTRPSRSSGETVFGADLERVSVPVLVVSHAGDRCAVTPASDAERIRRALPKSPKTEVMLFEGGLPPKSNECEAFAEHGYYGIEARVVDRISDWIKAQTKP